MKKAKKEYTTIIIEKNKIYEDFNQVLKKYGLKKSPTILKLMEFFMKNPEKVLFEK